MVTPNDPLAPPPAGSDTGCLVALFVALLIGGVSDLFGGLIGIVNGNIALALLVGILPGVILVAVSRLAPKNGVDQGLLAGGLVVLICGCTFALIGGACGAR